DVHAYLQAARQSADVRTLGTSWRADAGLLTAFRTLFDGVTFGHREIPHRLVEAAPGHGAVRLDVRAGGAGAASADAPPATPLRLRVLPRHASLKAHNDKII